MLLPTVFSLSRISSLHPMFCPTLPSPSLNCPLFFSFPRSPYPFSPSFSISQSPSSFYLFLSFLLTKSLVIATHEVEQTNWRIRLQLGSFFFLGRKIGAGLLTRNELIGTHGKMGFQQNIELLNTWMVKRWKCLFPICQSKMLVVGRCSPWLWTFIAATSGPLHSNPSLILLPKSKIQTFQHVWLSWGFDCIKLHFTKFMYSNVWNFFILELNLWVKLRILFVWVYVFNEFTY